MKTRLLMIVAAFLVMIPWINGLEFGMNNQVMADGVTISSITVMTLAIVFSLVSWVLLSWASKNIKLVGIPLSIITGTSLLIPFSQVLGPMAGIIVGIVAGITAFMLQKKIMNPAQNTSLIIAAITIVATYFVLTLMILAVQTPSHVWNAGDGIGEWTGTAQGMEEKGFDNIFNNNIGFGYFLASIHSLMITGLIIRGKTIKRKFLIVSGSIFVLSVLSYVFVMGAIGQCDLPLIFCTNFYESNLRGGSIDMDPDLSPSYALDFVFGWKSIVVFVPLMSGIIATILLSIHFILKKKNIRSRPYITIIAAAIMLYFGIQTLSGLGTIVMFLQQESPWHYLDQIVALLAYPIIGFSLVGLGIVFLYKSQLVRRIIQK